MSIFGEFHFSGTVARRPWVYSRLENVMSKMLRHQPACIVMSLRFKVNKKRHPAYYEEWPGAWTLDDIGSKVRLGYYDTNVVIFYDDVMKVFDTAIKCLGDGASKAMVADLESKFVEWCREELMMEFDDPPDRSALYPPVAKRGQKREPPEPPAPVSGGPSVPKKTKNEDVSTWRTQIIDAVKKCGKNCGTLNNVMLEAVNHPNIQFGFPRRITSTNLSSVSDEEVVVFRTLLIRAKILEN